jgi:5-formyltetrahydrofolate cyclo-ligase
MHVLQGKDKQIIISKSDFKSFSLKHFLLTDATIIKANRVGIPEPQDGLEVPVAKIDVVFVPLLAFDRAGHRIGYGKGFYDRFLMQCKKETLKVGLSFFEPLKDHLEVEDHDIPLDVVLTPENIFSFNQKTGA